MKKQIDERTIMFARMTYEEGSAAYEDYYSDYPEHKEYDDFLRTLPDLCSEGTAMFNEVTVPTVNSNFDIIDHIKPMCEIEPAEEQVAIEPMAATELVKKLAKHYGADLVGITEMKPEHYYSIRGRRNYGEKVTKHHKYGIILAMEMDMEMVNRAPKMSTLIESSNIYLKLGIVGMQLSVYLSKLGYDSRNHMDGNYLVVAPRVAQDAGLGEMGRHGLLLTPEFGGRVRLGVVTTDLELVPDKVTPMNLGALCDVCGKCIRTCPGKAIPSQKEMIDGELRYQINQEKCYEKWRSLGTDCGICLSSCPVSQGIDLQQLADGDFKGILRDYEERFKVRPYIREEYF